MRIVTVLIAILTMATMNAQTLTERHKGLAACACLMAQGDLERLEPAVRMALDNGVTINELKEAFSQLYAYTGFPRSLNAVGVLSKVLENNSHLGRRASPGRALQSGMMPRKHTNWARRIRRNSLAVHSTMTSVRRMTTI